jgi:hypothetical protein
MAVSDVVVVSEDGGAIGLEKEMWKLFEGALSRSC